MNQNIRSKTWILLGASRGLGRSFAELIALNQPQDQVLVASRKSNWSMDFAKKELWPEYIKEIQKKQASHILYFAGGGPFGNFAEKNWQDHEWTFKVNFEFPAYLTYQLAAENKVNSNKQLEQICLIGSSIAEATADPGAASYSAAKHAQVGLVQSLHKEGSLNFDLRLFSPGYMDTNLLPPHAWPRQKSGFVAHPKQIAAELYIWLQDVSKRNTHLVIRSQY